MTKRLASILFVFLVPFSVFAETGFVYKGDLNGDGIDDHIQSGPQDLFGNAGGPCVVTVSVSPTEHKKGIVSCGPGGILLEKSINKMWPSRLWDYGRISAGEGTIMTITLDGKFTTEHITLYSMAHGDDSIGIAILKAVRGKAQFIKFDQVENYAPPENPCGVQWGKSCLSSSAYTDGIKELEQDFISHLPQEPNCLWRIQADLNSDHYPEVLLTLDTYRNGKAGHIWQVYLGTKDGFVAVSETVSFRTDAVFIGYIHEIKEPGLLAYLPGSGSQGTLVAYQVKHTQLVQSNLGSIHPLGSDATKYKRYFGSPKLRVDKKPLNGGKCSEI